MIIMNMFYLCLYIPPVIILGVGGINPIQKLFVLYLFIINALGYLFLKCCCLHNYIDTNWLYVIYLYVSNNMNFQCLKIKYYI